MGYVTRYPNEPDEPFTEWDIAIDQVEDGELDKPVDSVQLEVSFQQALDTSSRRY
jgi:hypothetical protein